MVTYILIIGGVLSVVWAFYKLRDLYYLIKITNEIHDDTK
jgi:hypothetical protein